MLIGRRTLRHIGPVPPPSQIKPLSTYLSRPATDSDWIGIDRAPVLLGSALGLGGTPLGGFHGDLAHELLGLDDLDQPLQYLLPLGRRPSERCPAQGQGEGAAGDGEDGDRRRGQEEGRYRQAEE